MCCPLYDIWKLEIEFRSWSVDVAHSHFLFFCNEWFLFTDHCSAGSNDDCNANDQLRQWLQVQQWQQRRVITGATKSWLRWQKWWQQRWRRHRPRRQRPDTSYDWRRRPVTARRKTALTTIEQRWRLRRLPTVAMMTATTNNKDNNSITIMHKKFILLLIRLTLSV